MSGVSGAQAFEAATRPNDRDLHMARAISFRTRATADRMERWRETVEIATRFVVRLVACAMQEREADILGGGRGTAEVARARHVAMYLLHTSLSVPYGDVAALFERDRTTVSHACRIVEDLRDDPMQDDFILRLEEMVELARSMAATKWRGQVAGQPETGA